MAKKKKGGGGVRKLIKAAGPRISRSEIKDIRQAAGGNLRKAINQISKSGAILGSGAANMLIKQQTKAPQVRYDPKGTFGTSKLGQTLQSMVGTAGTPGRGTRDGFVPGTPPTTRQRVPGGMGLTARGNLTSRKGRGVAQPTGTDVGDTTLDTGAAAPTGLSADDVRSILDEYLGTYGFGAQQEQYDPMADLMSNIGSMFATQMGGYQQQLADQMALMNQFAAPQEPTRLYGAGQNYNIDAIRAAQRNQQRRSGYLRGGMGIGGQSGVTTGAPTSGLNIGSALGILGGVTG